MDTRVASSMSPSPSPTEPSPTTPNQQNENLATDVVNGDTETETEPDPSSHYISLRFTARFPQRPRRNNGMRAVADGRESVDEGVRHQAFNVTFDPEYSPSPLDTLNLHVRNNGTVDYSYARAPMPSGTDDDADSPPGSCSAGVDVCVVKEPIDLFPSSPPRPHTLRHLLLLALSVAVLASVAVPLAIRLWPPQPVVPSSGSFTSSSCSSVSPHLRHKPLQIFEDLDRLLHQHALAPLPIVSSLQDRVEKHYLIHPKRPDMIHNNLSITVQDFFAHIYTASDDLCKSVLIWAAKTRAPVFRDVSPICKRVARDAVAITSRWTETSITMASSWPSATTFAVFWLLDALEKYAPVLSHVSEHAGNNEHRLDQNSSHDPQFHNQTSHNVLAAISHIFFDDLEVPGAPPWFGRVMYDAAHRIDGLERAIYNQIVSLEFLLDLVQSEVLDAARVQKLRNDTHHGVRWFGSGLTPSELALAGIAPAYDVVVPLLDTATTLPWIIGFSHRLVDAAITEFERQGNHTLSLLAKTPPLERDGEKDGDSCRLRGMPWVTEAWEKADGGLGLALTRTYWYLPALDPIIDRLRRFSSWANQQADQSRSQFRTWVFEQSSKERLFPAGVPG